MQDGACLKVFGSGISHLKIVHRPGRENTGADALSLNPLTDNQKVTELDVSLHQVNSPELRIEELLSAPPQTQILGDDFIQEQRKDAQLRQLIDYIVNGNKVTRMVTRIQRKLCHRL